MTKLITQAVFNQTKQNYAISGNSVDKVLKTARRMKETREAICYLFFSRKTGKMVDVRMN